MRLPAIFKNVFYVYSYVAKRMTAECVFDLSSCVRGLKVYGKSTVYDIEM